MDMFWLVQLITPIGVCVVLPLGIVWLVFRAETNKNNKNAEIVIKAIENNSAIDADKLVEALGKKTKTPLQVLQSRLLCGCIFTLIGIAAVIFTVILAYNGNHLETLYPSLIVAGLSLACGIAYLIVYFVTRKSVNKEEDKH